MPIHSAFLKYFDEVRRSGSIRLAARKLYVASSAVNRQILKIEHELGVTLFDRSHKGLSLTPAGQILAEHISRTLADAEQTQARLAALRNGGSEVITVAGQESIIVRFLPQALLELHAAHPAIATAFKASNGTKLVALLLAGGADIAVAFDPEPVPGVEILASCQLPVGAVMSPDHPLAQQASVDLQTCAAFPLVLPDQSWPLRRRLDQALAALEWQPKIMTSSNSVQFLQTIVAQKQGIGFQTVVGLEDKIGSSELAFVPWHEGAPVWQTLALCVQAEQVRSPAMEMVLELLRQRLQDYAH
ncbi:MAG: LysR family transcriptional regulator [Candidatus Competibacteraceae bacterium]|nr:LysR family transcriptional regulator [Candidatus Competibacteraceae bacterium]MCB1814940.1 LysR family transcriptional regulator [Candidatus Competibacteraceae bacterium]